MQWFGEEIGQIYTLGHSHYILRMMDPDRVFQGVFWRWISGAEIVPELQWELSISLDLNNRKKKKMKHVQIEKSPPYWRGLIQNKIFL